MEVPPAPAYDGIAPTEAETAIWDWGNLLDFSFANDDPLILPWGTPEESGTPPQVESPPFPLPSPHSAALPSPAADSVGRVRKRDPRLVCPNYLAGVVPCSCPEVDEKVMEAEKVAVGARKRARSGGASTSVVRCQVPGCEADISELKGYHKRHRVCLECANASSVELNGEQKRYCQQCGKFHVLANFDEGKRSCRRKLERHNKRRRRKNNDPSNIVEKETEAQGNPLLGVTCDGELVKETPHVLGCNTAETVLSSKTQDGETVDSEDGQGSPIASLPRLKNDELLASVEAHKDERNSLSKSSPSSTFCEEKSAYSSRCPTGRISFKLYDWNPAEFPRRLRHQIFQWLENMPVELEGYIRPGCTILTVFIAMPESMWEKITQDVAHSLRDLINQPGSLLLGRGTFLIYLSNTIIQVLQDGTTLTNIKMEVQAPRLHYVYPSYFEAGKSLEFIACGSNLGHPKLRFLLSFCGKYLKHEVEQITTSSEHELFRIKVKHTDPEVFGPAFVEVENVSGISNFIPVLVGSKDVCSELERIEELFAGTRDDSSLVFHADASRSCKILMSRQYAMSTLLLDIAWLLKAPHPEEIEHLWSLTNVQRVTSLLKFLLPNKFCSILRVIVCHLDDHILIKGVDKPDSWTSNADLKQFHEYLNHAKEILFQEKLYHFRSEVESRNSVSRSLMLQYENSNMGDNYCANQDNEAIRDSSFPDPLLPSMEHDVEVPLVTKDIIHRHTCYQNSFVDVFSNKITRSRFPLFIAASVILCLVACAILFHPRKAGDFAISIRRCLFGDTA
ncbi:squamosa promoter-binding-like protein 9 [Curcuma longa]|uniref:squamosa promoter-binding-like protein 9 n=1 Tax=Curcuma longa TaxID=136217 RepID=UPI003D9E8DF5